MSAPWSVERYTRLAIILHWVMALGIAALVVIGLLMVHDDLAPDTMFRLYQLHKSIGVTVLLAAVVRLAWRLGHRPPPLPQTLPPGEKMAAHAGHIMLYAALFIIPITGWALVSSSVFDIPTVLYGLVPWPDLPVFSTLTDKAPVEAVLKTVHAYGAYALIALVALHIFAALRHQFLLRDNIMARMLPRWGKSRP
ncbi:cytochrome b [Gluconacetobacter diazotrophicus]|uniref:Cytochrome b n=1 Tax=Gluconacetobacter diazotrophicus TaxID=33996 RepID=A0A7W4NPP2_GLUDI|nr:cytochrome b [Gluconacetobacter diazotrophicus]MBB2158325.1 cytochrome b [Gluconacetobacter diazotrophicus]